jgi:hypothetical protein
MRPVVENPQFGLDRLGHKGIDALLQDPPITSVTGKRERSHNGVFRQVHLDGISDCTTTAYARSGIR